ncbi:MAG TPA: pyridoxal 5'-phosphate synthase glutaminase subunit PdxT [Acidimicrobiales bacterium]|nr:pyridoxal 5'-phosphate synthase glutaminase subunit PdxT [Acidimicrobiales bacterium]
MSGPSIGVLGLQGDVREHLRALERIGVEGVNVRSPKALAEVDALILPGGESTTLGMLLVSSGLDGPLRERLLAKMPAFGTCAGMILLSRTVLDGRDDQRPFAAIDISVRRNAFGRQLESFEADLEVAGLDEPMHAVFIRAPIVEQHGGRVEVLSSITYNGAPRVVVCREENVMVASFHPELTDDSRLHGFFLDIVRESTL